ncbi:MAG: hypothetical protein ACXWU4_13430, partial [Allosphingosinicella sp.]
TRPDSAQATPKRGKNNPKPPSSDRKSATPAKIGPKSLDAKITQRSRNAGEGLAAAVPSFEKLL